MESENPLLRRYQKKSVHYAGAYDCTLDGTMQKTFMLFALATLTAGAMGWTIIRGTFPAEMLFPALIGSMILGLGIAIALAFKPIWSPTLAPLYAVVEGVFLGAISIIFETLYPGIAFQAIALTLTVAFLMLVLYRTEIIKVTEKFRTVIVLATLSIFGVYVISWILLLFGVSIPLIHESGPIGIIFSLVVVTIAALNLLLDFDLIERVCKERAPKYMEWFGAFALLVTVVWLYIEMLKLLAKIREN